MQKHWTEKSIKNYLFRIVADFIVQLEAKMKREGINQEKLATLLKITPGAVSQVLNQPGNMKIDNIIKYARAVGLKVSLVAYDDGDKENIRGPINSEIFKLCWEQKNKPTDFWDFQEPYQTLKTANTVKGNNLNEYTYFPGLNNIRILETATSQGLKNKNCIGLGE